MERYGSTEAMILCSNPLVGERRPGSERLIGSIRRECTDHIVMFGERHLRHVLLSYMGYYNGTRTHLSLNKDAPISRAAENAGRISVVRSWAGCTINMAGCDLRWAQRKLFDELLGCKLCF